MAKLSSAAKKAQRFLPLTFKRACPQKVLDLGEMVELPHGFFPTNPSILRVGDDFLICVRGVNYILRHPRTMKPRFTCDKRHRTVNKFFVMSSDLSSCRALPQLDQAFLDIEDVKLFAFGGAIYGTGSRIVDHTTKSCCMTIAKIDAGLTSVSFHDIPSPFGIRQEKNWSPFIHQGAIHFLYSYHPLVILRYRPETGTVQFRHPEQAGHSPQSLSFLICGSSPGIETLSGFLFVAHRRSVRLPSLHRAYFSRLYHLDRQMTKVTGGSYFVIERPAIQFVNGLLMDERSVYVSYGHNDNSAHLACFDLNEFLRAVV